MFGHKKCSQVFSLIIVVVAVLLAILASILPPERIDFVIVISRFFDIMLPVLAVGALLKYLCKCPSEICNKDAKKTD